MAITREEIRRNAIDLKRIGMQAQYTARPVAYQFLEIANNDINAVDGYWFECERNCEDANFDWTPNDVRDKFLANTRSVFTGRVDSAYMLRPEQRQAAEMFRGFCNYAAGLDWNNQQTFEQLQQLYGKTRNTMLAVLAGARQKTSDLQERRMTLMKRRGLPYREATM